MGTVEHKTTPPDPAATPLSSGETELIDALRRGDEAAFVSLIERYQAPLIRLAMMYVSSRAVAEEVVQETWMGVLQGLGRFEGRSSLKTWIFQILTNRAKTRGEREHRFVPFSAMAALDTEQAEPAVDPDRFLPPDHERWPGHWAMPPRSWDALPEDRFLSQEIHAHIQDAIATLPSTQQMVISLRDIEGWTSEEVCNVLGITETNQRVLLHRARSRVRRALERYLSET